MKLLRRLCVVLMSAGAFAACFEAAAQIPKDRGPVRLVVGFPAGGSADVAARLLADRMSKEIGVTVIVDNRPGAGGAIAANYVKSQAGDGLTVMIGNTHTMVTLPLTNKTIRYAASTDFRPAGRIAVFAESFAVSTASSAQSLAQWLDLARANAALASFGIPAPGSVPHLIGYSLGVKGNVSLVAVPYRGSAPLAADLVGNQLPGGVLPVADVYQLEKTAKLRVLAVSGMTRSLTLPNVPTFRELGYPGFEALEWIGLFAPPSTPPPVIDQLNAALNKALNVSDVREGLVRMGMDPRGSSPDDLGKEVIDGEAHWGAIVKASGISVE